MFSFDNIKKLINYDWKNIIERTVPKGNKMKITEESYQDIQNGSILSIIASVASSAIAFILMTLLANATLFGGVNLFGLDTKFSFNLSISSLFPIIALIYNAVMKDREQNSYPHFAALIYLMISSLYSVFGLITWIASMFINPFFGILGIFTLVVSLFANVHIIVGCMDFCCLVSSSNETPTKNSNVKVKTKAIKTNEVSETTTKSSVKANSKVRFCTNCGMNIADDAKFCGGCGKKVK